MLKEPRPTQTQLEMVTLESLVPQNHLVRYITAAVDFEFIRDEVSHLYSPDNGRPAIDPVRLLKMMFLGYLFGIPSERKLVAEIEVNVAYRWFLGMGLTDKVIHHSTLSQNRLRRFADTDIFQRIFDHIVVQAMQQGLVGGLHLYADSTHLKANANKHKYRVEDLPMTPGAYVQQLDEAVAADRERSGKKPLRPEKQASKTQSQRVSGTDPDSGFMVRDEKPQGFFYLDHRTVDGRHNIIVDTHATPGNVHDSQPIISRIDRLCGQFDMSPHSLGLDAGYFTAAVCHELEAREVVPVMGYRRPTKRRGYFAKRHYVYDSETDTYRCPEGQVLHYSTTSRNGYRRYHSDPHLCATCPVRMRCTRSENMTKVVTRHVWQASVEHANEVRLSAWGKQNYRRRAETVERSFADAKQHHGHRYCRYRGLVKVGMQCLLAAACQNMKKMALVKAILGFFTQALIKNTPSLLCRAV